LPATTNTWGVKRREQNKHCRWMPKWISHQQINTAASCAWKSIPAWA
jgi:hypothetical protein